MCSPGDRAPRASVATRRPPIAGSRPGSARGRAGASRNLASLRTLRVARLDLRPRLAALAQEDLAQRPAALLGQPPGRDLDAMVEPRLVDHVQHRAARARLGIVRAVDQAPDPRE